ncbi:HAD family phosphatase [uncultured Kriegella sp.]|uniref:HAD family hydrolase n=1 Tax=uncultured Kriegella sp. TaxID=1798910 RepID=UPI0030DBC715|tara:strand:+ start:448808 stop:449458 length:651 start_codon:yes stop_codon:yes gene_type:complete
MISTVIFDMNGVITDDEDLHELATQKAFEKVGLEITPEIYRQYCLGRTDAAAFVDLVRDFQLQKQEVGSLIADKTNSYQALIADNLKVYPGVIELIERLHQKYTLALTTSSTFEEVQTVVGQLQLENLFKVIVSSKDVKRGKPDPEPYILTAQKLGVACENCAVIEDSENGVRSAVAAGMKCIAIPNTEKRGKLTRAHFIIDEYSELTDHLIQSLG